MILKMQNGGLVECKQRENGVVSKNIRGGFYKGDIFSPGHTLVSFTEWLDSLPGNSVVERRDCSPEWALQNM